VQAFVIEFDSLLSKPLVSVTDFSKNGKNAAARQTRDIRWQAIKFHDKRFILQTLPT
jgi:hypothetical protein